MLKILKKIFDNEYKELKRFKGIADAIEDLDEEISKLTDEELKEYTDIFKERLAKGESLDDILIDIIEKVYEKTISIREMRWNYKAAMDYDFNLFNIEELKPYRSDTDGPSDENPFTAG